MMRRLALAAALAGAAAGLPQPSSAAAAGTKLLVPFVATAPVLAPASTNWSDGVTTTLDWDYSHGKPALEPATVRIAADAKMLYVRFDVPQTEPIAATQHVNDIGDGTDDEVTVYLWPGGINGFRYQFSATPNGTHYQYSTENAIYAPTWISHGETTATGYAVTMAIPFSALRADGKSEWLAQFSRYRLSGGETDEWTHAGNQSGVGSALYAGVLDGIRASTSAARTKPRLGLYTLGEAASPAIGGPTSRMGADIAVPVTPTASFVAAIHPDFSNVEIDQQTISPTAFQRYFTEVRPFFSQSAANIYSGNCSGCPNILELYTPSIPTPRDGYALEGTQGAFSFGAFDAVGVNRDDTAETLAYATPSRHVGIWETHVADDQPGFHDDTQLVTLTYDTLAHVNAYFDYGSDSGTNVLAGNQAQRYDGGVAYYSKDDYDSFTLRKVGQYYDPYDGLVSLTDIAGYSAQINRTFRPKGSPFQAINISAFTDHYQGTTGGTDLTDGSAQLSATLRDKFTFAVSTGFSSVRLPTDILRPADQQGFAVLYLVNTALQDQINVNFGRYGDGYLTTIDRDGAFRVMKRATFSFNLDSTDWLGDRGLKAEQWLERGSLTFDLGSRSSLTFGARKIVGTPPPFGPIPAFQLGTNLSFGYALRRPHDELYFVYGDASQFSTRPAITLKLIHYFGAEKGT
jgi:hypothetical protein